MERAMKSLAEMIIEAFERQPKSNPDIVLREGGFIHEAAKREIDREKERERNQTNILRGVL